MNPKSKPFSLACQNAVKIPTFGAAGCFKITRLATFYPGIAPPSGEDRRREE